MQQIADWLKKLGMSEYAQRFIANRPQRPGRKMRRSRRADEPTQLCPGSRNSTRHARGDRANRQDNAKRRQLIVIFCGLVGSTALSIQVDPEDMRSVIGAYHRCVAETLSRFDGFVAKYVGDGVFRLSARAWG
jgi:class 3 adenylate cyclase